MYTAFTATKNPFGVRYSSGGLVWLETFEEENLLTRFWSPDARVNQPWEMLWSESFEITVNNMPLTRWEFAEAKETSAKGNSIKQFAVRMQSLEQSVELTVHTRLDGTPAAERWLTVSNTGNLPIGISKLNTFAGELWRGDVFTMGRQTKDTWCGEGWLEWADVPIGQIWVTHEHGLSFRRPFV
ncbi:MAG: hypothetical protein FWE82_10550, partial [Defluviitaleaceae bacterium]|nr:hypothetical protein [Defluviitaleaceae bacterium]